MVKATHLKNYAHQIGSFPQVGVRMQHIWNHQPGIGIKQRCTKQFPIVTLRLSLLFRDPALSAPPDSSSIAGSSSKSSSSPPIWVFFLAQRIHGTIVYLPNMYHKNQLNVDKYSSLMGPLGCLKKNNLHMLQIGNSDPWKNTFSGRFWCMRKTQRNHLTTYELFQNGFIFPNFFWGGWK